MGGGAAVEPALDSLCYGQRLWHREADRGIDVHALIGCFFDGGHAGIGHRDFHHHVRRQLRKMDRLLGDRLGVPVKGRVRLDRNAPLETLLAVVYRLEQFSPFDRHLFDQLPGDVILGAGRIFGDDLVDTVLPQGHLLL